MKKGRISIVVGTVAVTACLCACGDDGDGAADVSDNNLVSEAMCGDIPYNPTEKFCAGIAFEKFPVLISLCGGMPYNPDDPSTANEATILAFDLLFESKQVCRDGVVYGICGESEYNTRTHFCYSGNAYEFCGGQRYAPDDQVCDNGVVRGKCGNSAYDFGVQTCRDGKVYSWCGEELYDPETQTCP